MAISPPGLKSDYVLGLCGVVLLASCMTPPPLTAPMPSAASSTAAPVGAGSALAALTQLPVKGRASRTGYARAQFGEAWTDDNNQLWGHNGCSTREDVLRRDLADVVLRPGGCKVASGTLRDPYTGRDVEFVRGPRTSTLVQIDHVVPLSNAWQTGAQQWTQSQRQDFANDPLELLAAAGAVNEAKGDGDAATWLPSDKMFRCEYAARMVAIKLKWHLWVTPAERDVLARLLGTCGSRGLPAEPGVV